MSDPVTVLIVEDEPLVRIDLADFFRDEGFRVAEAADAAEAITLLEQDDLIRLIVTDVDMPGSMDGLMLARAVRDRWPPVHIVVVSGHRAVEITDIPDGSVFFSKPVRQPALLATVNDFLT